MNFIFKILLLFQRNIAFVAKVWTNRIPRDLLLPVVVEGKIMKVFKHHWAGVLFKKYEPETIQVLKHLVTEATTFIDIGANTGLFSHIALQNGANVISFEPHPKAREILKDNIQKRNAKIYPYALSNEASKVKLFLSDELGSHSLFAYNDKHIIVEAKTLDSLYKEKVDLIKIDVEGAEMNVLQGMKELLKAHKPDLIIEVDREHLQTSGWSPEDLISYLSAVGYEHKKIGKESNYLFLAGEKSHLFKEIGIGLENIWVEWLGIWGSGKTTLIESTIENLSNSEYQVISTREFFSQTRFQKLFLLMKSLPYTLFPTLKFFSLVLPKYVGILIKKDIIGRGEFRSFVSCFLARVAIENQQKNTISLWEGEFHLLPVFSFSPKKTNQIIDLFLDLQKDKTLAFIFLCVDIKTATDRIVKDQSMKKNIRFGQTYNDLYLGFLEEFQVNQRYLINRLRERGITVFESTGDIEEVKGFIRELKKEIFL